MAPASSASSAGGEDRRLALGLEPEQLHQREAAEVVAHWPRLLSAAKTRSSSSRPTLAALPGEYRLAEADGRVGQGRGDAAQQVRRHPADSQDLLGREDPRLGLMADHDHPRRPVRGHGRFGARPRHGPEQTVQRCTEVQLAAQAHQTDDDLIAAVRNPVYGTDRRHLDDDLSREARATRPRAGRSDTDPVTAGIEVGPRVGFVEQCGSTRRGSRRGRGGRGSFAPPWRRHCNCGSGWPGPARGNFGRPSTPISFQQEATTLGRASRCRRCSRRPFLRPRLVGPAAISRRRCRSRHGAGRSARGRAVPRRGRVRDRSSSGSRSRPRRAGPRPAAPARAGRTPRRRAKPVERRLATHGRFIVPAPVGQRGGLGKQCRRGFGEGHRSLRGRRPFPREGDGWGGGREHAAPAPASASSIPPSPRSGFPFSARLEGEVGVVAVRLEPGVVGRKPLSVADEEEAGTAQQSIERGQRTAARGGIEVDQHVTAEDDVVGGMATQEVGVEQVAAGESDGRREPRRRA